MTAGKNYNIVTKLVKPKVGTFSALLIGSAVATGLTRYVTYIRVQQGGQSKSVGSKLYLCSVSISQRAVTSGAANTAAKMVLNINRAVTQNNKVLAVPDYPDPENPLFTIAASKFLTVTLATSQAFSASCTVFVQYYDQ